MVFWKGSQGWWKLKHRSKGRKKSIQAVGRYLWKEGNHQGLKSKLGQSTCTSSFPSYNGHIQPDHVAFQVFESLSETCTFYKHQYQHTYTHFTCNLTSLYMVYFFFVLFLHLLYSIQSREQRMLWFNKQSMKSNMKGLGRHKKKAKQPETDIFHYFWMQMATRRALGDWILPCGKQSPKLVAAFSMNWNCPAVKQDHIFKGSGQSTAFQYKHREGQLKQARWLRSQREEAILTV